MGAVRVRDLDAAAVLAEGPAVERAAEALPLDLAADAEVGAEVRAVGIDQAGQARRRAVEDEVPAEQVQRPDLAGQKVGRLGHDEPAVRHREGEAPGPLAGHLDPPRRVGHQLGVPGHRQADQGLLSRRLACRQRRRGLHQVGHVTSRSSGTSWSGVSPWISSTRGPMRSTNGASAAASTPYRSTALWPRIARHSSRGHVLEPPAHELAGVGERALGVREVVAPQEVADADLVAAADVLDAGCRRRERSSCGRCTRSASSRSAPGRRRPSSGCCARRGTSRPSCMTMSGTHQAPFSAMT